MCILTNEQATKSAVMYQLDWLVSEAGIGDTLVFIYSGHGARFSERAGLGFKDETKDEALVLFDSKEWKDMLIDDDLSLFFGRIPFGAHTTVICDCCFSGGVDLCPTQNSASIENAVENAVIKFPSTFSNSMHEDSLDIPVTLFGCGLSRKEGIQCAKLHDFSKSRTLLLSACGEDETAAPARPDTDGLSVFSYYAISALNEYGESLNASELIAQTRRNIKRAGHSQTPRLVGREDLFTTPMFE